jgi:response regulator RpfG family c-di-GMP phosphodiesterase
VGTRILIVEDEPVSLQILELVLQSHGAYEVLTATTVDGARERVDKYHPALIISDRFLGKEDGVDLCRHLKGDPATSDIMFMLLTAASETSAKITGLDAGADDYITKPYNDEELMSRVRALLRIKTLQDDLKKDKEELQQLNVSLNGSLRGVTNLLTNIIEIRVPNALERAQRAFDLVHWVGERLELEKAAQEMLELAARIHEIGKVTIPDDVLAKDRHNLSAEELGMMQHFPLLGQMLVGNVPQLRFAGKMLRHQMENVDGTGHPDRLEGREIPLPARIMRAVNFIEELEADGVTELDAVRGRISGALGTILDPRVGQLVEEYLVTSHNAEWMVGKKQVTVQEIAEGMVLALDLLTAKGMKLLPKDSRLTSAQVSYIQAHHLNDPIARGVYVYA